MEEPTVEAVQRITGCGVVYAAALRWRPAAVASSRGHLRTGAVAACWGGVMNCWTL